MKISAALHSDDMFKTSKSEEEMADPISEAFQVWIKSSSQLLRMNIRCIKNEHDQVNRES